MRRVFVICAAILAVLMLTSVALAEDEAPEGLFLGTLYQGNPASACSVLASYYRPGWQFSRYYTTGYTGPGGRSDYPPLYNVCRFAREEASPPRYVIPFDTISTWRFYAYKEINGQRYYSDWSKVMRYGPPNHYYDADNLYLTRTSPPLPDPPWVAEE